MGSLVRDHARTSELASTQPLSTPSPSKQSLPPHAYVHVHATLPDHRLPRAVDFTSLYQKTDPVRGRSDMQEQAFRRALKVMVR